MSFDLNISQIKSLSNFFSNMAVAWFIAGFVSPQNIEELIRFIIYGIFSLYFSIRLLK